MNENKPHRRWLRFDLRDLLWAMVVLGLGLALWSQYRRAEHLSVENKQLQAAIANSGLEVTGKRNEPWLGKTQDGYSATH
jgi:hypothetical protein